LTCTSRDSSRRARIARAPSRGISSLCLDLCILNGNSPALLCGTNGPADPNQSSRSGPAANEVVPAAIVLILGTRRCFLLNFFVGSYFGPAAGPRFRSFTMSTDPMRRGQADRQRGGTRGLLRGIGPRVAGRFQNVIRHGWIRAGGRESNRRGCPHRQYGNARRTRSIFRPRAE
jgi:hypothetical protein